MRFSEGGHYRTLTLHESDVAEVAAALARYDSARDDIDQAAEAGLAALRARLAARREARR